MADAQRESLGKRLRQERERHRWPQEQLAEQIGGSVPSIHRWEHDRAMPRQDLLMLLTVALSQTRAISGLGGIGKTQIAVEYLVALTRSISSLQYLRGVIKHPNGMFAYIACRGQKLR